MADTESDTAAGAPGALSTRRLPAGRHNLPREFVANSQRDRILDAMAIVCARSGYADAKVADVVAEAEVSRSTFYEFFSDLEECFLAAYDLILEKFLGRVAVAGIPAGLDWPGRIKLGLREILGFLSAEPAFARMCMIDVFAAGPEAQWRYRTAIRTIAVYLDSGRAHAANQASIGTHVAIAAVGGSALVIRQEIIEGRQDELPHLLSPLLYAVLVPYLDRDEALAQARVAAAETSELPEARPS